MEEFYRFLEGLGYRHPIHPTQINMPIGLVVGTLILGLAALMARKASTGARSVIVLAFIFLSYGGNAVKPRHPVIGSHKLDAPQTFVKWLRKPEEPMPVFAPQDMPDAQALKLYDYIIGNWGEHESGVDEHAQASRMRRTVCLSHDS